jgi:hypothetical protein
MAGIRQARELGVRVKLDRLLDRRTLDYGPLQIRGLAPNLRFSPVALLRLTGDGYVTGMTPDVRAPLSHRGR